MKKYLYVSIVFVLLIFLQISSYAAGVANAVTNDSMAPMLQKVMPAIVNIKAQIKITDFNTLLELQKSRNKQQKSQDQQNLPSTYTSVGSGVIVDASKGYILTNAHVVADAQLVVVTQSDGHHYTAKIVGLDKPSDIALLQIKAQNLTAINLGDSNQLKVGDFVAAVGNPFGLSQSVTSGIVSALGRTTLGIESFENFIQTDAPINPGNSGGALINMQGQLVGINTAMLAPSAGNIGIGFAIPSNMAKSVMAQLIQYGDVKRGQLGIGAQDITPDLATAFNLNTTKAAVVTQILQNSPAEQAGIQVGDIITSVNGVPITNGNDVINIIGFLRVDSKANLTLLRNHKTINVSAYLSDPKKRKQLVEQQDPYLYGVGMKNFTAYSPIHGNVSGIGILSVDEDSNAWRSDLRPGDVITSINQQKVTSVSDLKTAVAKASNDLLLNVIRGPAAIFLVINKEP